MKIARSTTLAAPHPMEGGLSPGAYPYLGASVGLDGLQAAVSACGAAVVRGVRGATLAARTQRTLIDPASYETSTSGPQESLFPCDEWLDRQRAAGVPLLLTDSDRIHNGAREELRKALGRWEMLDESTLVVLPLEPWWLQGGLACLTEEVRAAGRPIGLVLLGHYNPLDAAGSIAGLLTFISALDDLPVVVLRCDVSAVGAVAHGVFAGFAGMSASTRHGPLPMRRTTETDTESERDDSAAVLVPALHAYHKVSKLPAFTRAEQDVLRCDCWSCSGQSLLRVTRLNEIDIAAARAEAYMHNVATQEQIAREVFAAGDPRDAWWKRCKAGADTTASLIGAGITLSVPRWLQQWLEVGSPSHEPVTVG